VNAPSVDEPNLQIATVIEVGEVMKQWKVESGTGTWTGAEGEVQRALPPLRLTELAERTDGSEQAD
jgi:hypothetical protein